MLVEELVLLEEMGTMLMMGSDKVQEVAVVGLEVMLVGPDEVVPVLLKVILLLVVVQVLVV